MRVYMLLLALVTLVACRAPPEEGSRLRIAYMARLTHAPALTGIDSGRLPSALPDLRIEGRSFEFGNAVVEAMFAGEIDVALLGPNPAINGFVRSAGEVRIVSGIASGGSALVVRQGAGISSAADLRGRSLATPQVASTQDIALRAYLRKHGLDPSLEGGDVRILPLSPAEIRVLFARGDLDGAFVSEPLATELVMNSGATLLLDERDEWPGRRHPATVFAVRKRYYDAHPENVRRLVSALAAEIDWIEAHRAEALVACQRGIRQRLGRELPSAVATRAFDRVSFTVDPMPDALDRLAHDAERARFLPPSSSLAGLVLGPEARE